MSDTVTPRMHVDVGSDAVIGSLVTTVAEQSRTIIEQAEAIKNLTSPREVGAEITVAQSWELYSPSIACRTWWRQAETITRSVRAGLAERNVLSLRPSEWPAFRDAQLSHLAPGTRNAILIRMCACWNWLVADGLIARNPWATAKLEKAHRRRTVIGPRSESEIVGGLPLWAGSLVTIKTATGMRIGELIGLRWDEVDLGRAVVHLPAERTKTHEARDVALSERACSAFRMIERCGPFVFPSPKTPKTGKPYAQASFRRLWRRASAEVPAAPGDGHVRPHDCRHTAGTRMSSAGVPVPAIAKQLGHRQIATTMRYVHVGDADMVDLKARLDGGELSGRRHGPVSSSGRFILTDELGVGQR